MEKFHRGCVAMKIIGIMTALLLLIAACSSTSKTTDGGGGQEKEEKTVPLYYEFEDVLIPRE